MSTNGAPPVHHGPPPAETTMSGAGPTSTTFNLGAVDNCYALRALVNVDEFTTVELDLENGLTAVYETDVDFRMSGTLHLIETRPTEETS